METCIKYLLPLFALSNIMAVYRVLTPVSDYFFYGSLIIGLCICILNLGIFFKTESLSKYKIFYIYIGILWIYQLVFGHNFIYPKTWTYLIAKTVMLAMTMVCIERSPKFYLTKFYPIIIYASVACIIFGFFKNPFSLDGRFTFGFGNPNALAGLASICFCYLLIVRYTSINYLFKIGILILFIFAVLCGGSRAGLAMLIIGLLYRYRLSLKTVIVACLVWLIFMVILPKNNINFIGIERLSETLESENMEEDRELEREATLQMIESSPIEGNGIYCEQSYEAQSISELGSHNGYLDIIKWFGYPFGITLIASFIIIALIYTKSFIFSKNFNLRAHLIVVIGTLLMSNYEGLIWGVNEINNTLFFVSFAVLGYYNYEIKRLPVHHPNQESLIIR